MSHDKFDAVTAIPVCATNKSVADILKAQYGHLESGEVRALLEQSHSPVWSNDELLDTFEVSHFEPPYVHVIRKTDGQRGTVMFIDSPRFYFAFSDVTAND
jgi:hypothetical protein